MRVAARMGTIGTESAFEVGTGLSGAEMAERLLGEAGVCVLAGTAFGGHGGEHIRISHATSRENLVEALRRIDAFVGGLGRG